MNHLRNAVKLALAGAVCFVGIQSVNADDWNKKTIITINEPLQVPNTVLDPGKYVLKLLDSPSDRHIVQIFNADETKLITTILAIPNYRLQPTGKTEFNFWEVPAGQPHALRAWFYPGDNFGQEFAYPPAMSAQISKFNNMAMPTTYAKNETDLATAKVEQTPMEPVAAAMPPAAPTPEPMKAEPVAAPVEAPAPAPAQVSAMPAPAQDTATDRAANNAPAELPHTGSNIPSLALMGLLSLGAYVMLTADRRRNRLIS